MATSKLLAKLSCRLQPFSQTKLAKPSSVPLELPFHKCTPQFQLPASALRISRASRLPVELGSLGSMMPFHNAVASARLVSSLSIESLGWGLVPQGISMPL